MKEMLSDRRKNVQGLQPFFAKTSKYAYILFSSDLPPETFVKGGADGGNRTHDQRITNALLYQLSYVGMKPL